MTDAPPIPPGFQLEGPPAVESPPIPPGFQLESAPPSAAKPMGWGEYADNLVRQGANAITFNTADEIDSALGAVPALFDNRNFSDVYNANLAANRAKDQAFQQAYPKSAIAAQVVGGLATAPLVPGLGLAGPSASIGGAAAKAAAAGGLYGAAAGFGAGEGGVENRIQSAAQSILPSMALGGAVGAGAHALGLGGAVQNPTQAAAADRLATADKTGVPLTKGQASGDVRQQGFEQAALAGAKGGTAANLMQGFAGRQNAALQAARQKLATEMGGGQTIAETPQQAGDIVAATVKQAATDAKAGVKAAYKATPLDEMAVNWHSVDVLPSRTAQALNDVGIPLDFISEKSTPQTRDAYNTLLRVVGEGPDKSGTAAGRTASSAPAAHTIDAYHYTDAPDFGTNFDPTKGHIATEKGANFFSLDPARFNDYAGGEGGRGIPVKINPGNGREFNVADLHQSQDPAFLQARRDALREANPGVSDAEINNHLQRENDWFDSQIKSQVDLNAIRRQRGAPELPITIPFRSSVTGAVLRMAKAEGLDTATIRGMSEGGGDLKPADQIMVLNPDMVKSKFDASFFPSASPEQAGMTLDKIDRLRKALSRNYNASLNAIGQATDDSRGVAAIKSSLDNWLNDSVYAGLVSGDPKALDALKNARSLHSQFQEMFGMGNKGDKAGPLMQRLMNENVTGQDVANMLYGGAQVGAKGASTTLALRLQGVLGRDSEEWNAIRQGALARLTQSAEGTTQPGPQMVSNRIFEFVNGKGKSLAQVLFSPKELDDLRNYAATLKLTIPNPKAANPSGSGFTLLRAAPRAAGLIGGAVGFHLGGFGGMFAGNAAAKVGASIKNGFDAWRATRRPVTTMRGGTWGPSAMGIASGAAQIGPTMYRNLGVPDQSNP